MNNTRTYYSHDAELRAARERVSLTVLFMLFGLGAGAAAALLFAPRSGEKTREELTSAMEDGLNSGREAVEPTLKRLQKEFSELRQKVDDRLSEVHLS